MRAVGENLWMTTKEIMQNGGLIEVDQGPGRKIPEGRTDKDQVVAKRVRAVSPRDQVDQRTKEFNIRLTNHICTMRNRWKHASV